MEECCKSLHIAEIDKKSFLGDTQHRNYYDTKYLFHHLKSTYMHFLSNISVEMFLNIMEETPEEKCFLSGDWKPKGLAGIGLLRGAR